MGTITSLNSLVVTDGLTNPPFAAASIALAANRNSRRLWFMRGIDVGSGEFASRYRSRQMAGRVTTPDGGAGENSMYCTFGGMVGASVIEASTLPLSHGTIHC